MSYVFQEKFNIYDLIALESQPHRVAILEPEQYLAKLYEKYLRAQGFEVIRCTERNLLHGFLSATSPRILLLNPGSFEKTKIAIAAIGQALLAFPELLIVTIGYDTPAEELKELMSAGIASHINRKLSKPADVVYIIKTLLAQA